MRSIIILLLSFSVFFAACARQGAGPQVSATPPERRLTADGQNAAESATASAPTGGAFVVYVEHRDDGSDIFFQAVDGGGFLAGDRTRVNDRAGTANAWKGDPPTIAVDADGSIYVGWTRRYDSHETLGSDLMLSVSKDGGRSFDSAVKVNDDEKPAAHGMHSLAIDPHGRVIMAWLDERNAHSTHDMSKMAPGDHHEQTEPNSEIWTAYSDDAGRTFSRNSRVAENVCPCCKTTLLAAADGNIYVSWRQVLDGDHRHIAVANSKDGGRSFLPATIVSNDKWQLSSCPVSGAALTSTEKDEVEVAWYTAGAAGPAGLYYSHSHDAGSTFSARELVSDAAKSGTPAFANVGGQLAVVFNQKEGNVKILTLGEHGAPLNGIDLANGAEAAITALGNKVLVTYTRPAGNAASVWLETVPVINQ